MKRLEVIDRLKAGATIVAVSGYQPTAQFSRGSGEAFGTTVRYDTVLWLERNGLVNIKKSESACGLRYISWKE